MAIVVGIVSEAELERIKAAGYEMSSLQEVITVLQHSALTTDDVRLIAAAVWVPCDVEDLLDIPGKEKANG